MTVEDVTSGPEGYVYVATNPAMPDIVKIGSTTQRDPKSRISQLFTTSVPVPFELVYAAAIAGDPSTVERALHTAFAPQRMHPGREFFEIEPYQVVAILRLLDVADVTEEARSDVDAEISRVDRTARERAKQKKPWFNFFKLGLPAGSVLSFLRDDKVKVEVVDERQVCLIEVPDSKYPPDVVVGDERWHLSPLTKVLLGVEWGPQPTPWWRVEDGRRLSELHDEWWASVRP